MGRCISIALPCSEKSLTVTLNESAYSFSIYNAIAEVDVSAWNSIIPHDNLFLSHSYLSSLEKSTGSEVQYRYLVIQRDGVPEGAGFFQIINFRGSNVENDDPHRQKSLAAMVSRTLRKIIVGIINKISMNLLVSGNTFVTGEYGFHFSQKLKDDVNLFHAVNDGIEKIISQAGTKISGILIKDYYESDKKWLEELKGNGFLEFLVNPNMILGVKPSWKKFEDYLGDMASKYRTRMRKALKRAETLTTREMDAAELERRLPEISSLYDQVVDEAAFKLAKLNIGYIVSLKKELAGKFGVVGFFKGDELVTFISYYKQENDLVAGYMGMNRSLNHEYDLYLNVLLKLAEIGIINNMQQVVYGRTAMEIKSSVGALPHTMFLYVKHRSTLVNLIIKQVVRYLSKEEKWTLRNPFK